MRQLTEAEAIKMAGSNAWKDMTPTELFAFQLSQSRLCVPFSELHRCSEEALGRPVFTHEFATPDNLREELVGVKQAPSFDEILNLIPEEKLLVVRVK